MSGLHIAFFGSSILSAYWNGAATYYRGIIKALHARGHRITFYEPDAFGRQEHRDMEPPDWVESVVYPAEDTRVVDRHLADVARRCDVAVKASGVGVFDEHLDAAVCRLGEDGLQTIYWDVDAPATLDRIAADPEDPLRPLIPHFDRVFTYGGGPRVVDAYHGHGARACTPIYNAHDPDTHHPPAEHRPAFAADCSFLGNRLPDRQERVEEFLLSPASALPARRFLLGGSGWEQVELPDNVQALGHVGTRDHNAFYATPMTVLNVNRASMAAYGWSPATRIFEAAAAGACIISDDWPGLDAFFSPEREILIARDGDAVRDLLDGLDPERARAIGSAARARALADHTYQQRAETVCSLLTGRTALPEVRS